MFIPLDSSLRWNDINILDASRYIRDTTVAKLLEAFGYFERSSGGGSHRAFVKPGHTPIIVPTIKGRRVKRAYIKMIIERLNLEDWYEETHGT